MAESKKHKSKNKHKNKQSFTQKLFSKLGQGYNKKQKKPKHERNETNGSQQIHGKTITVTSPESTVLKEVYTVQDVVNYQKQMIRNINDEKRKHLVTEKLRLCSVRFDFTTMFEQHMEQQQQLEAQKLSDKKKMDGIDIPKLRQQQSNRIQRTLSQQERHVRDQMTIGIDKKRQMLVEIVEFISTQKWWDEDILKELIHCVASNLFRTLPLRHSKKNIKGDEDEEIFMDPEWLHLQLVYELCLRFLISNDIDKKVMQKHLHGKFVLRLIQLFQSQDLRERDYLKTILHRIYGRFMPLRQQIRTEIANECFRYVYGEYRMVHGIAEFLDIFSSIINGFSIPVKDEHKAFLRNVLLPLHKCDKYEVYFQQLADCCVLFVNKDQAIATTVLAGLLKFWPRLSPTKQAFYLREMLNVIGALVEHENGFSYPKYREIVLLCVNKIFECMESPHFQVADQALSLWKDTVMLYLSKCQKDMIWRRLFIIFKDIELNHWNSGVQNLCKEVVVYYERIDNEYWQQLKDEYEKHAKSSMNNGIRTRSNANDLLLTTNHENESSRDRSNDVVDYDVVSSNEGQVVVPSTLVPAKYQAEKRNEGDRKRRNRKSKYISLQATAARNKGNSSKTPTASSNKDTNGTPGGYSEEIKSASTISPTPSPKSANVDDDDHKDLDIESNSNSSPNSQGSKPNPNPNSNTQGVEVTGGM